MKNKVLLLFKISAASTYERACFAQVRNDRDFVLQSTKLSRQGLSIAMKFRFGRIRKCLEDGITKK